MSIDVAKKSKIPFQIEVIEGGATDAASVYGERGGIPSIAICVPTRYIHSNVAVCALDDIDKTTSYLVKFCGSACIGSSEYHDEGRNIVFGCVRFPSCSRFHQQQKYHRTRLMFHTSPLLPCICRTGDKRCIFRRIVRCGRQGVSFFAGKRRRGASSSESCCLSCRARL